MINLYLSFADEAEADSVLCDAEGNQIYRNTDTIGVIQKPTGEIDADGNPVVAPIAGWHVNVLVADGEDDAPL